MAGGELSGPYVGDERFTELANQSMKFDFQSDDNRPVCDLLVSFLFERSPKHRVTWPGVVSSTCRRRIFGRTTSH